MKVIRLIENALEIQLAEPLPEQRLLVVFANRVTNLAIASRRLGSSTPGQGQLDTACPE